MLSTVLIIVGLSSFGFLVLSCFGLVIDYITKENNYIKISLYKKKYLKNKYLIYY